jgi:carboxyl-terminal processing protease
MLPATNRGVGMHIGFPDVCLTPVGPAVVPIPYPNFALTAQAVLFSPIVRVSGVNALNLGSMIPMTFGDEPGVAHWSVKGPGRYVMGNPIVFIDRLPAINLTCPTTGNTANNALGAVLVPSAVNVFYTYAHSRSPAVTNEAAGRLGAEMLGSAALPINSTEMLSDWVGLIRVSLIPSDMARQFHVALKSLEARGAKGLVIDLRACPGGDLDAAIEWCAPFLPEGAEIVRIEDAEGDEIIRRAHLAAEYTMPVAVLVDEWTASAAEVFAGALKAHGRAVVIGRTTYGKSTVQCLVPGKTSDFEYPSVAQWSSPFETAPGTKVLPDVSIADDTSEDAWMAIALATLES